MKGVENIEYQNIHFRYHPYLWTAQKSDKKAIFLGELKSGDMLPSIRQLAKTLKISVITTKRAYDDLEAENFIISKQGKGSYVSEQSIEFIKEKENIDRRKITELINLCKTYSIEKASLCIWLIYYFNNL